MNCKILKNLEVIDKSILHKYDANDPLKPIMTCRVYGTIPEAIELAKERKCENYNKSTA